MKISVHRIGRFHEVVFHDYENDEVRAASGLLNDDEAKEMAARLHEVADELWSLAFTDTNQIVLPFVDEPLSAGGARQMAMGY
jgi:hypothetical protein